MTRYLLDTNHLGLAVRPSSPVRQRIRRVHAEGGRFGTCIPVLCELEIGIRQVRDSDFYRKTLARFLTEIRVWPLDQGTVGVYAEIYEEVRRAGRVLSQIDMTIAAMARQSRYTVLTTDRDFEGIRGIRTQNWSIPSDE